MAAVSSGPKGRLAMLVDEATQQWFLVDTGSSYSIIPHRSQELTSGPRLCTSDPVPIACWGDRKMHVAAGGRRFKWPFLLADVALPITGADLLRHFVLLVDLGEMWLLARKGGLSQHLVVPSGSSMFATIGVVADRPPKRHSVKTKEHIGAGTATAAHVSTSTSFPTVEALSPPSHPASEACGGSPSLQHVLEEFPEVLPKPTHRVQHFLVTEGHPVTKKYRRLENDRLEAAKKEFAELEKQGIMKRSSRNWASPLHMVKKADGTWRPCGDYRLLNMQTQPDLYSLHAP